MTDAFNANGKYKYYSVFTSLTDFTKFSSFITAEYIPGRKPYIRSIEEETFSMAAFAWRPVASKTTTEISSPASAPSITVNAPDDGLGNTTTLLPETLSSFCVSESDSGKHEVRVTVFVLAVPIPQALIALTLILPEVVPKFTVIDVALVVSHVPDEVDVPSDTCPPAGATHL